jgi:hypothetical protein
MGFSALGMGICNIYRTQKKEHVIFALQVTVWDGKEVLSAVTGGRAQFFSRLGYGGNRSSEPFDVAHGPE